MKEKEKKQESEDIYLSPSSINSWYRCQYYFYKVHIEKVPTKKTIHLVKGNIVHNCLEKFFDNGEFEEDLKGRMDRIFKREWRISPDLKELKLDKEDEEEERKDIENILNKFLIRHLDKMEALLKSKPPKAENLRHAWFILRPRLKEVKLESPDLRVRGRADRIFENFDGIKILADYKTSNRYGIGIPEDYRRQAAIYALLYQEQEKEPLDFVSIIYLRFGEEPMLEVTPSLIRYARDSILKVREATKSKEEKDYPRKMSALCNYCQLKELCDGTEEYKSEMRKKKFKKLLKGKK